MLALEHKKPTSRSRAANPPTQQRHKLPQSANPIIQRASCACGGSCPSCQAKSALKIGAPDDAYEREADAVADQVMRMAGNANTVTPTSPGLQRKCAACEKESEEPLLQAKAESSSASVPMSAGSTSAPANVEAVLRSPGQALDSGTRAFIEPRLGWDVDGVRVHTDSAAQQSARDVNAHAYTVGHHIVFGTGRFAPRTHEGQRLLAHELTHVAQQGGGRSLTAAQPLPAQRPGLLQRQEGESREEDTFDFGEVTPSTSLSTSPPEFGDHPSEPGCPPVPTNLGNLQPDPPCPTTTEDISGTHFQFCIDSDVFIDQSQVDFLRGFARRQRAGSIFKVHGFASTDGEAGYNLRLSCHRAKRAARELQNAGVPSQEIQIAAKGETASFGPTQADNRIALIGAEAPPGQTTPNPTGAPTSLRDAVDRAVARIQARDYRLAADAYVSRWTCGVIPNLAEMVRRTTILVEGQEDRARVGRNPLQAGEPRQGHPNVEGLREIVIANEVFSEAGDPILCATARIIDMAFHHFLAPHLGVGANDEGTPVHRAALFLVELAGFPPCETPARTDPSDPALVLIPPDPWWRAPTADPLATTPPDCPDQTLPGAINPQHQPSRPVPPPTFTVSDFRAEVGESNREPQLNRATNQLTMTSARRAIGLDAQVTATGNPTEINRYQIGFLQTVIADSLVAEFVSGHVVEREVPVPLRDRTPDEANSPPWFRPSAMVNGVATGAATTELTVSPTAEVELAFENFERRGRLTRGESQIQDNNPLNRAFLRRTYNTWLVARRDDVPLDRFSTQFLAGRQMSIALAADVLGTRATGNYRSDIEPTPLNDPTPMQLRGPTPEEVDSDTRIVGVRPPTPRAQAGGLTMEQIRARVRQVVDELAPLRTALHLDGPINVRVRFDRNSGRMILDTPRRPATVVEESRLAAEPVGVSETGREELGHALTIRLRKDLVAAPSVPDLSDGIPTALNSPLPSFTERSRRQQGRDPNPFADEHGLGVLGLIREANELNRSDEQLRTNPSVYDPTFSPRVEVRLPQENYCYNFGVSGVDIDQVCDDPTLRTEGCVRWIQPEEFTLRSDPTFLDQQLGGETFHSPVSLRVTTFPILFVMFTPRESPGGTTFNHEMHHLIDSYDQTQNLKDRLARRIRARLMEIRRLAVDNPQLKDSLLSRATILEIIEQENKSFLDFFRQHFLARGDALHAREAREGLPPYRTALPASWTTFREPPLRGGTTGSFDDKPCR